MRACRHLAQYDIATGEAQTQATRCPGQIDPTSRPVQLSSLYSQLLLDLTALLALECDSNDSLAQTLQQTRARIEETRTKIETLEASITEDQQLGRPICPEPEPVPVPVPVELPAN